MHKLIKIFVPLFQKGFRYLKGNFSLTSAIALTGLLLSLWNTYWQFGERHRTEYEDNAYKYHPELQITDIKFLLAFKSEFVKLEKPDSIPTLIIQLKYDTARVRVYFQNVGNAQARIHGYGFQDTAITEPILRENILHTDEPIDVEEWKPFYSELSIASGARDSLDLTLVISRNPGISGIFHFIILYENQRGSLFDTYCWIPYRLENLSLKLIDQQQGPRGRVLRFGESNQKLSDQLVNVREMRLSPMSYTSDEAKTFLNRMNPR